MAIRLLSSCSSSARLLLRWHLCHPMISQQFSARAVVQSLPDLATSDLVNELSRILSDYRSPHHDIQSALTPFSSKISTNLVEQVLKRCKNLGFSAHRFFLWARSLQGFRHSIESHHILVEILGSSKQFPLIWDFLVEIRDTKSCEISPKLFWLVFGAYSRANLPADATRAFNKMLDFGITPSVNDLDQLLYSLCKRKHVNHAQEFFDRVKMDFLPSAKTYSILIRGWGEMRDSESARKLFDEMLDRGCLVDLPAYNSVLESLCKGGNVEDAYNLFRELRSKGLQPDAFTYSIFIHAFCEANDLHSAFRVLDRMKRYKLVPNVFTYNCIIKKLCRNDKIGEAYQLLDEMLDRGVLPDVWSYNAILAFHCDRDEVNRALRLISRMDEYECQLDRHTYNMVLKMLIRVGRFDRVEKVWGSMEERGFYPSVSTYAVMVHGLCKKKGKLEEACRYFEMMIDEGIPPYTATCDLLRNKLIWMGFTEQTDILADKMERSTSCSIQELSNIMRGNRTHTTSKNDQEYLDDSDDFADLEGVGASLAVVALFSAICLCSLLPVQLKESPIRFLSGFLTRISSRDVLFGLIYLSCFRDLVKVASVLLPEGFCNEIVRTGELLHHQFSQMITRSSLKMGKEAQQSIPSLLLSSRTE